MNKETRKFICHGPDTWIVDSRYDTSKRQALISPLGFETIVNTVLESARVVSAERNQGTRHRSFYRPKFIVEVGSSALNLFHSSACGYRAQYYQHPDMGNLANRFAIDSLIPLLMRYVSENPKWTLEPTWVLAALKSKDARIWIHQGTWYRIASSKDHVLLPPKWSNPDLPTAPENLQAAKKKLRRGLLIPDHETQVEVKGTWLNAACEPDPQPPKSMKMRALDIHLYGFT